MDIWLFAGVGVGLAMASVPHLLFQRKRPAATLAWLWFILLFPYLGTLAYWAIGTDRLARKRLRRRAKFREQRGSSKPPLFGPDEETADKDAAFARLIGKINDIPASVATNARILSTADAFYTALEERFNRAQHHIHVQFFIWRNDDVGQRLLGCLVAAAKRGVQVRVLVDEIGSVLLSSARFKPLMDAGGEFSWFLTINPRRHRYLFNLRNHRKLQIIDGTYAFVGGMNVGREYQGLDPNVGAWKDLQIEVQGPVVSVLQESFADDWHFATQARLLDACYYPSVPVPENRRWPALTIAGGPDSPSQPVQKSLVAMLGGAQKRVWLTTGYFVPNDVLITALQLCASRGVDVRLLVSEKTDHPYLLRIGRSYYEDLLRAGVKIFEYSRALNHSKCGLMDDDWLLVGSANIDNRSMRLNFELSLLLKIPAQARELEAILTADFNQSEEVKLAKFCQRRRKERFLEAAFRPFAPVL